MRLSVWCAVLGSPDSPYSLPYDAQSPSLSKVLRFETIDDVLSEVSRLIQEAKDNGYPIAQSLYIQCPLFADIRLFLRKWHVDMINDYWAVKNLNIPLSSSLETVNVSILDSMLVIDQELNEIKRYQMKLEASKK